MVMLGVQSLPYAATFFTATVSALSNQQQVKTPLTPAADPLAKAALLKPNLSWPAGVRAIQVIPAIR